MGSAKGPSGVASQPSPGWEGDQSGHSNRRMLGLVPARAPGPGPLLV